MTEKEIETKPDVQVQIIGIDITKQEISRPELPELNIQNWAFDIALEMKLDISNKFVIVILKVIIQTENKELTLGSITTNCIYQIANWDDVVKISEDGMLKLPDEIIIMLNSISISTTRGILYSQLRGTFLHNAILPMVDPKQFKFIDHTNNII